MWWRCAQHGCILLIRSLESKDLITNVDQVAGLQHGALHALPVDERAVGAAEVVEDERCALAPNLHVMARGARTGDGDMIVSSAPDGERLIADVKSASGQRTAHTGQS